MRSTVFWSCVWLFTYESTAALHLRRDEGSPTLAATPSTETDLSSMTALSSVPVPASTYSPSSLLRPRSLTSIRVRQASRSDSKTISTIDTTAAVATTSHIVQNVLPLSPDITPAVVVGGIILISTGITLSLVGIKDQRTQIFLSGAYLAMLSMTVLIDCMSSPHISNAFQGAFLVAIVITGVVLGAGALLFKSFTEGLACLLGGFCFSMWLLTLKAGGSVPDRTSKGIFIAVFCASFWSLSLSHRTRELGLIGSTSFAGSTAFILGIDCFSKAGLKEFWLYIWNVNPAFFPPTISTYPITRGIRVESIVLVLASLLGVGCQLKYWKTVKDWRKEDLALRLEEEHQRDAAEEALGRQFERQNERARALWESIYKDCNGKTRRAFFQKPSPHGSVREVDTKGSYNSVEFNELQNATMERDILSVGSKLKPQSRTHIYETLEEDEVETIPLGIEANEAQNGLAEIYTRDGSIHQRQSLDANLTLNYQNSFNISTNNTYAMDGTSNQEDVDIIKEARRFYSSNTGSRSPNMFCQKIPSRDSAPSSPGLSSRLHSDSEKLDRSKGVAEQLVPTQQNPSDHTEVRSDEEKLGENMVDEFKDTNENRGLSRLESINEEHIPILAKTEKKQLAGSPSSEYLSNWTEYNLDAAILVFDETENTSETITKNPQHLVPDIYAVPDNHLSPTPRTSMDLPLLARSKAVRRHSMIPSSSATPLDSASARQRPRSTQLRSATWGCPAHPTSSGRLSRRSFRHSSGPLPPQSIAFSAIDENTAVNFAAPPQRPMSQQRDIDSFQSQRRGKLRSTSSPIPSQWSPSTRAPSSQPPGTKTSPSVSRAGSIRTTSSSSSQSSRSSHRRVSAPTPPSLSYYTPPPGTTHTPGSQSTTSALSSRATTLAELRAVIRRESAPAAGLLTPKDVIDLRRADLLAAKQQEQSSLQQRKADQWYREYAFENAMRRADMQALHREALRRMQAGANRRVS